MAYANAPLGPYSERLQSRRARNRGYAVSTPYRLARRPRRERPTLDLLFQRDGLSRADKADCY